MCAGWKRRQFPEESIRGRFSFFGGDYEKLCENYCRNWTMIRKYTPFVVEFPKKNFIYSRPLVPGIVVQEMPCKVHMRYINTLFFELLEWTNFSYKWLIHSRPDCQAKKTFMTLTAYGWDTSLRSILGSIVLPKNYARIRTMTTFPARTACVLGVL